MLVTLELGSYYYYRKYAVQFKFIYLAMDKVSGILSRRPRMGNRSNNITWSGKGNGNLKIRRIIIISVLFTLAICICSLALAFANGADRRQMEITYENGQKQQVNMQQSADNIIRIEFQGVAAQHPPDKSDFGSTTPMANSFKGEVYFIAEGVSSLPNLDGQRAVSTLYTTAIDISHRRFDKGFPGIPNRVEWFAIRYTGEFYINMAGTYRFRTIADDGCWLVIDGKTVIDDRRGHAPSSASGEITLSQGTHQIRLDYFQGPRYDLALQLFVTQQGSSEKIFDLKDFSFSSSQTGQQRSGSQQPMDDVINKARGLFR